MAITPEFKETWKDEKEKISNEISSLKNSMTEYKEKRKSEWKSFKKKFIDNLDKVEKSLKKLNETHKKK